MGATIGLLQLMHPAIGAGVMEHSDFFGDPYDRVFRSLPAILGAAYDGPTPRPPAGGCATSTRRSRASTPRAAATTPSPRRRTGGRTPPSSSWPSRWSTATTTAASRRHEREQLYQEGLAWYRRYGVSDRDVPAHPRRVPGAVGPLLRRGPRDERGGRVRAAACCTSRSASSSRPSLQADPGSGPSQPAASPHLGAGAHQRRRRAARPSSASASTSRGPAPTSSSSTPSSSPSARPGASSRSRPVAAPSPGRLEARRAERRTAS